MFVMTAAFMSILLLMVARHHPPSRRKIKKIWHGHVYWEQESNTTLLRVPIYNKTLSDLKSSPTPEEDKTLSDLKSSPTPEEDKPKTNSVKVDKIKLDINVDENLVHIDSQEQKIRLKIGDFKKSQNKPYDFKMIVLVHSARSYKKRRDTIRATWAKGHGNVFFMVGKHCPFKPEQRKWGKWNCVLKDELKNKPMSDIIDEDYIREQEKLTEQLSKEENVILLDMIDVYRHTSMKLRHGWLWALKNTNADYIVKTDDDAFARVDSLEHWLMNRKKHEYEGISHHWAGGTVHRGGKWGERKYKKGSSATYPPWPAGPGWLFSRPVIEYFATHQDSYVDYQGEDTAVGIWMNRIKSELTIKLSTSQHFHVHSGDCHNRNYFMIGHNISPQKMRECYKTMDEFPVATIWKSSQQCECDHGDPDLSSKECLCKCERGYSGKRCEIANKCSSNGSGNTEQIICQNDGSAIGVTDECACTCQKYYEGTHCETYKWPMTYFIQMNKEERIKHVATIMKEHPQLNAKIWNAITPDTMHDEIYSKYVNKKTFEKVRAGAVGCALSHITLLSHMINNNIEEVLIFEDDAVLFDTFETDFMEFRKKLPDDAEFVQLLHHDLMNKQRPKANKVNDAVIKSYSPYGTVGLFITLKGASKLLPTLKPIWYPIDEMFRAAISKGVVVSYMPVKDLISMPYILDSNIWNTKKNSNPLKKKPPKTLPKICSFFQPQFDKTTFELITQILLFFHQLSEELSFDYTLIAGSVLGYYRHNKNFIPWDDDFDVYLKEDKFISVIKKRIDNSPTLCYKSLWLGFKIYFCDRPKIITNPTYNVDWSWPALDVYTNEHDDPRKSPDRFDEVKDLLWPSKLSTINKIPIRIPNNLEKFIQIVFGTRVLEMCFSVSWNHKTERGQTQKKIACKELVEKCGSQWPKDTWPIETPVKDVLTRETDKDTCKEYPRHKKCSPIDESKYKKDIISTVEPIRVPSLDYTYPLCPWVTDGMGYPRTVPDGIRKLTGNKRKCVDRLMKWAREGRTTFTFDAGGLVSSTTSGGLGFGLDDFDMYIASEDGLVKDLYAHCPEVDLGNHGMVWLPKRTASNYRDKFVEQADRMCTCELDGPFLCVKTAMDDTPTVESLNFGPGVWDYYGPTWSERNWQKRRPIVLDDDRGSAFMSVKCMFGSAYWMRPSTGGKALQNNFILQWIIPGTGLYKQEPWLNANIKWCSAMGFSASKLTMENIIHWADINIEKGYQNPFWLNRMFKKSPCFIENSRAFMQNACSFLQKAKEARKNTDKLSEVFESFHGAKVLSLTDPEQQIICRKNVLKELCGPGEFKGRWEGDRFRCFDETSDFVDDWKKKIDKVLPSPDTFFPKCVWPKPLYPKSNWKALSSTKKEKVIAALNILKNKVIDDQKYFMYVDSGMVLGLYRDGKWVEDGDIDVRYGHVDGQVMSQSMLSMNNVNKYGAFWPSNLMNSVRNPTISEVAYIRNRTCIHDSMIVLEQKYMVDFFESYYGPSWFVKLPNPGKYHSFMPYWSSKWKEVLSVVKRIDTDNDSEIDLAEMIEYMKKDGADPKQIKAQLSEEKLCKGSKTLTWFLNHPNFIQKDFKQMEDRKYIDNIFSFPECEQSSSTLTKHPSITKRDRIMRNGWDYSPIVIEKYNLLLFTIPKNACTVIKQLARRMMGLKDWKIGNDAIPHNPKINGLRYLRSFPIEQATEMMTSPKWTRAIFLREPYTRLLSAYLDKAKKNDYVKRHCGKQPTSFSSFIKLISTCKDPHWSLQKSFVDDKWWPYINFKGRVSTAARDMKELLQQKGLWQQFGSNGWSNGAIFEKNGLKPRATDAQNKINSYYDDEIRETVRAMYAKDFAIGRHNKTIYMLGDSLVNSRKGMFPLFCNNINAKIHSNYEFKWCRSKYFHVITTKSYSDWGHIDNRKYFVKYISDKTKTIPDVILFDGGLHYLHLIPYRKWEIELKNGFGIWLNAETVVGNFINETKNTIQHAKIIYMTSHSICENKYIKEYSTAVSEINKDPELFAQPCAEYLLDKYNIQKPKSTQYCMNATFNRMGVQLLNRRITRSLSRDVYVLDAFNLTDNQCKHTAIGDGRHYDKFIVQKELDSLLNIIQN